MSSDPEFDQLRREFLTEAEEKIREISSLLVGTSAGKEARDRMIYLAHQLKGAGGSYGFPTISSDAAALESGLEKMGQNASADLQKQIERRLARLTQVIETRLRELS